MYYTCICMGILVGSSQSKPIYHQTTYISLHITQAYFSDLRASLEHRYSSVHKMFTYTIYVLLCTVGFSCTHTLHVALLSRKVAWKCYRLMQTVYARSLLEAVGGEGHIHLLWVCSNFELLSVKST